MDGSGILKPGSGLAKKPGSIRIRIRNTGFSGYLFAGYRYPPTLKTGHLFWPDPRIIEFPIFYLLKKDKLFWKITFPVHVNQFSLKHWLLFYFIIIISPECLDGAQKFLKPTGISIPSSYTSYIGPIQVNIGIYF